MPTKAQREMKRRGVVHGPCKQRRHASGTTKPLPVPRRSKGPKKVSAAERQKRAEQSAKAKAVAKARKVERRRARLERSRMLADAWIIRIPLPPRLPELAGVPPWEDVEAAAAA